jgi:hypothetical protein
VAYFVIETNPKKEMCERGREVVEWLIELFAKREVGEREGEMGHWEVEPIT